jgi:hypothetical protein
MTTAWGKDTKEVEKDMSSRRGGKRRGTKEVEKDSIGIQEKDMGKEKTVERGKAKCKDHQKDPQARQYSTGTAMDVGNQDIHRMDVHTWGKGSKEIATRVEEKDTPGINALNSHMVKEKEKVE